jgi:hypothetical protein
MEFRGPQAKLGVGNCHRPVVRELRNRFLHYTPPTEHGFGACFNPATNWGCHLTRPESNLPHQQADARVSISETQTCTRTPAPLSRLPGISICHFASCTARYLGGDYISPKFYTDDYLIVFNHETGYTITLQQHRAITRHQAAPQRRCQRMYRGQAHLQEAAFDVTRQALSPVCVPLLQADSQSTRPFPEL